jgi:hypothetical protein
MINYIKRDDEVIIVLDGVPYPVSCSDRRFAAVKEALFEQDEEELKQLLSIKGRAEDLFLKLVEEGIETSGGGYTYLGTPIAMDLAVYLRAAIDDGNYEPVVNFIKRLFENPSHDTRSRMFRFMEVTKMPILPDGRFLAFKIVCNDYSDKRTKAISNAPGTVVPKLDWSKVDTDPNVTCSRGYHACSRDYLRTYYNDGDRIVAVAIGPEDVGTIPTDYNDSKLRCRGYEVLTDITDEVVGHFNEARINYGGSLDPNYEEDDEQDLDSDYY